MRDNTIDTFVQGVLIDGPGVADLLWIEGNQFKNSPSVTAGVQISGATTTTNLKIERKRGFSTESRGLATMTTGTTVTVLHNLAVTPTLADFVITPAGPLGSATSFWVSNPTATTFDINVDLAPGQSVDFAWRAGS